MVFINWLKSFEFLFIYNYLFILVYESDLYISNTNQILVIKIIININTK